MFGALPLDPRQRNPMYPGAPDQTPLNGAPANSPVGGEGAPSALNLNAAAGGPTDKQQAFAQSGMFGPLSQLIQHLMQKQQNQTSPQTPDGALGLPAPGAPAAGAPAMTAPQQAPRMPISLTAPMWNGVGGPTGNGGSQDRLQQLSQFLSQNRADHPVLQPTPVPVQGETPDTPGMIAAKAYGGSPEFGKVGSLVNKAGDPLHIARSLGLPNSLTGPLTLGGALFRKNRPAIGDIAAAMAAGTPITDAQWLKANYGPGGAALPTKAPGAL